MYMYMYKYDVICLWLALHRAIAQVGTQLRIKAEDSSSESGAVK